MNRNDQTISRFLCCVALVALVFSLTGCAQLKNVPVPRFGVQSPMMQLVPERTALAIKDLAPDVKLVLAALLHQMYMEPGLPKEIKFSRDGRHQLYDPSFDYSGFFIRHVDISVHESLGNDQFKLGGVFHFEDGLSRRTSVLYQARYRLSRNELVIEESAVNPLQPTFPQVEVYFVSEQSYAEFLASQSRDFMTWYLFALAHAERMAPTAAEIQARNEWDQLSLINKVRTPLNVSPRRYVVMVFSLDRITDDGYLLVNFSNRRTGCPAENHEHIKFLDDNGWKIGLIGAELTIDDWNKEIFVNVGYAPGEDFALFTGYPMLIGSFSTNKNYTTISGAQYIAGPLEQGQRFLNPRQREDARLIQARLADHGFYRMDIDGLFGPGSLSALQAFKKSKGLGDNPNWDMATQKELFGGSGQ